MALPGMVTDDLADVPPIDANPDDYDIVRFEAEPGDVIVHDWKMLHGSAGNVSADRLRRADSVRLAGDDVTFHQRPSSPEPFRYTVGLAEGDPLDRADRFPASSADGTVASGRKQVPAARRDERRRRRSDTASRLPLDLSPPTSTQWRRVPPEGAAPGR
ncbi:MAG: phytanoyl-CoA dioxygenase family protein [Acidimicrobiales bacterium]